MSSPGCKLTQQKNGCGRCVDDLAPTLDFQLDACGKCLPESDPKFYADAEYDDCNQCLPKSDPMFNKVVQRFLFSLT